MGSLSEAADSLRRLQLRKTRWEPEVSEQCDTFSGLRSTRAELDESKTQAKQRLDEHM